MSDIVIDREETETKGRFLIRQDGETAELTFSKVQNHTWILDHTGVPDALGGRGLGKVLVRHAVEAARAENKVIIPLCPFAKALIAKTPDWQDVLKKR